MEPKAGNGTNSRDQGGLCLAKNKPDFPKNQLKTNSERKHRQVVAHHGHPPEEALTASAREIAQEEPVGHERARAALGRAREPAAPQWARKYLARHWAREQVRLNEATEQVRMNWATEQVGLHWASQQEPHAQPWRGIEPARSRRHWAYYKA